MAKRPRDSVEREIMDIIPERFDADSGSQGARRGAHTRLILSVALGLLAIAALGVAARHLLVGESQQPSAESAIPEVKSDDKPIKTKPEDRGGMSVPNQDKLVYQDVGKGDQPTEPERLMPPAEKPQVPAIKAPAAPSAPDGTASASMPSTAGSDMPAPPPAVGSSKTSGAAAPAPQATTAPAQTAPAPAAAASTPSASSSPPAPAATTKPMTMAAAAPTPAPSPAKAATPTANGGWQVQLAAMKSDADAQAVWKKVLGANKDLLGTLTVDIEKADLGAKGIYYRLRAGPLDQAAAKSLCAALEQRKQGCLVARK